MPHLMITERVLDTTVRVFRVDPETLRQDTRFRDLTDDDLTVVEYFMALEEEFGVPIEDDEAERLQTLAEVVRLFQTKLGDDS